MHNWVTISLSPLCVAMLLLASNIFEFENWLVDSKYIFFTHSFMCLHSSHVSLKYIRYTFFPLVSPFFDSCETEINTKYNNLSSISKYVYMTQEERKIWKTSKDNTTIIILRVTSKFVRKIDVFEDVKEKTCNCYIKNLNDT